MKKWLFIFICFLILSLIQLNALVYIFPKANTGGGAGGGGITFDSTGNSLEANAGNPQNFNHTINTLNNGYIVVHLSYYLASSVSGVTFDGTAMTLIAAHSFPGETELKTELWGLAVGSKTVGTYVIGVSGIFGSPLAAFSTAWNGVHQSSSLGTPVEDDDFSSAPSIAVSSASGELVVDIVGRYNGETITVGASQTERGNLLGGTIGGACSSEAGAASVTMSWTLNTSARWVMIGVPLKPAQ